MDERIIVTGIDWGQEPDAALLATPPAQQPDITVPGWLLARPLPSAVPDGIAQAKLVWALLAHEGGGDGVRMSEDAMGRRLGMRRRDVAAALAILITDGLVGYDTMRDRAGRPVTTWFTSHGRPS